MFIRPVFAMGYRKAFHGHHGFVIYKTNFTIKKSFEQGGNTGELKDIKANYIIPVDLNSIMFMNYNCISEFYAVLGDTVNAELYAVKAR